MKWFVVVCLLLVALSVVSCQKSGEEPVVAPPPIPSAGPTEPTPPETSGIEVVAVQVGDAYDEESSAVTNETDTFAPETEAMHVSAGITGIEKGATITGKLTALKVTDSEGNAIENYEVSSEDLEAPAAESTVHFEFTAPDKGWPVGSYEIDVSVGGQSVKTIPVTVE